MEDLDCLALAVKHEGQHGRTQWPHQNQVPVRAHLVQAPGEQVQHTQAEMMRKLAATHSFLS